MASVAINNLSLVDDPGAQGAQKMPILANGILEELSMGWNCVIATTLFCRLFSTCVVVTGLSSCSRANVLAFC